MVMERINVLISDKAKEKLLAYQRRYGFRRQDQALEAILEALEVPDW
jgi:hypothetical protein